MKQAPPSTAEAPGAKSPAASARPVAGGSLLLLAGLILGLGAGVGAGRIGAPAQGALELAAAFGQLWLDALTMTVVPLVFGLIVTGVAAAGGEAAPRLVARTAAWFAVLLLGACALSAVVSVAVLWGLPQPRAAGDLAASAAASVPAPADAPWWRGVIPTNPIKAAAETAIAPLVVFALLFALAVNRIDERLRASVITFFEAVTAAVLVIVRWVLVIGPLGVFALATGVGARFGLGVTGALVHYLLVISAACAAVTAAAYLFVALGTRNGFGRFAAAAVPVQAVALGTQSSLASLSAMAAAAARIGVAPQATQVILPLAVSVFRMSSAAANMAVALWLASAHGVALEPGAIGVGVAVAAAVSLAAVGLPAQVSFFATIAPICLAMGVPVGLLPILLAVETLPDLWRTVGNVTWDLAAARVVGGEAAAHASGSRGRMKVRS
ncbi:cation:dicarboxylase symporter family transporter [Caulobacter segnis]|uniref:dicarboxylate/amino acid:cation symporter n=1 Tax=Caulobacter segnis TaxID=88688 RepID=UPI00240FF14A|nr:cation:dicarboxylase symporter family transporter [Caulobacter segnis]MDG2520640.1 cation:dicarboxylase symporter family transporter [Caulobacter segnis]